MNYINQLCSEYLIGIAKHAPIINQMNYVEKVIYNTCQHLIRGTRIIMHHCYFALTNNWQYFEGKNFIFS